MSRISDGVIIRIVLDRANADLDGVESRGAILQRFPGRRQPDAAVLAGDNGKQLTAP
jgi:hypothetical protein